MEANFSFFILPKCNLTPERVAAATALIKAFNFSESDFDFDCGEPDEAAMLSALVCYQGGEFDNSREIATLALGGAVYYLTGGMSWGDLLTREESCGEMRRLEGIFDQLEVWSREDVANNSVAAKQKAAYTAL